MFECMTIYHFFKDLQIQASLTSNSKLFVPFERILQLFFHLSTVRHVHKYRPTHVRMSLMAYLFSSGVTSEKYNIWIEWRSVRKRREPIASCINFFFFFNCSVYQTIIIKKKPVYYPHKELTAMYNQTVKNFHYLQMNSILKATFFHY